MTDDYLQIMIESLEKKIDILDKVIELDKRQLNISLAQPLDVEAYDASMEEKGELIDEIGKLDDGFTVMYERVKEPVAENPDLYREKVKKLQELIRIAVDKGVSIEAMEKRNKQSIQAALQQKRREIRQIKVSSSAATKYYQNMSKVNYIDPQLMDRKK